MTPLELIDVYENQLLNKVQVKPAYTSIEVEEIIRSFSTLMRKSVYNGEMILELETADKKNIQVENETFIMSKILSSDDKYLLFLQTTDETVLNETDMDILYDNIRTAVANAGNISGVLILPPGAELSLVTAKLNQKDYAEHLGLTEEDLDFLHKLNTDMQQKTQSVKNKVTQQPFVPPNDIIGNPFSIDTVTSTLNRGLTSDNTTMESVLDSWSDIVPFK